MSENKNLLTTAQAADALGIDPSRVRRLISTGQLPAWRPSPRVTLIRVDDVAYLKANRKPAGRPRKILGKME